MSRIWQKEWDAKLKAEFGTRPLTKIAADLGANPNTALYHVHRLGIYESRRQRTEEAFVCGHPATEDNTYTSKSSPKPRCLRCKRAAARISDAGLGPRQQREAA